MSSGRGKGSHIPRSQAMAIAWRWWAVKSNWVAMGSGLSFPVLASAISPPPPTTVALLRTAVGS
ncbi:hypothetical protein MY494_03785 [Synechococcus sp. A10-1-5-1]|uniref:hypothetical protein n=1 Tax=Synechococcus sp. A10-1-5-1 TaxID=2936507 RepID=UPI0020014691|nr:hypothetical protein [Synechococcus sp. A10-1-5-1]UPM50916.1 hypothetical protein MY494_03785 [Synechococcus sp. A10-1-5-1]